MTTEVLIVGAGPTGLMLANQLGRRGVRATIVDRHGGPALHRVPWPCRRGRSKSTRSSASPSRPSRGALQATAATAFGGCGSRSAPADGSRTCSTRWTTRGSPSWSSISRGRENAGGIRRSGGPAHVPRTPGNAAALAAVSIAGPAYYLVRPDGYVALAGSHFDEAEVRLWFADNHVHAVGAGRTVGQPLAS